MIIFITALTKRRYCCIMDSEVNSAARRLDDMEKDKSIKLFEEKSIRTHWDEEAEKWYFSIVDVCAILSESIDPTAYWRKLKQRLVAEGNETVTNCHGLKMLAADGKNYLTGKKVVSPLNAKNALQEVENRKLLK